MPSVQSSIRPVPIEAIVFDFDGIIVNSEPLHLRAAEDALAARGLAIDAAEYYDRYVGYDDVGMFTHYAEDHGIALDTCGLSELLAAKAMRYAELEASDAVLVPGAAECVRRMAEVAPLGIASGARRDEIERMLDRVHLRRCFAAIVAAGETAFGKPAPDPYARAAHLLGAPPARTVAIEDTAAGLASARTAGLLCIGVTTTFPASKLQAAHVIVSSLDEITAELLRKL